MQGGRQDRVDGGLGAGEQRPRLGVERVGADVPVPPLAQEPPFPVAVGRLLDLRGRGGREFREDLPEHHGSRHAQPDEDEQKQDQHAADRHRDQTQCDDRRRPDRVDPVVVGATRCGRGPGRAGRSGRRGTAERGRVESRGGGVVDLGVDGEACGLLTAPVVGRVADHGAGRVVQELPHPRAARGEHPDAQRAVADGQPLFGQVPDGLAGGSAAQPQNAGATGHGRAARTRGRWLR
ncbi:hypothetical protein BJF83_13170 [Nocardiopsis sp. CNR-923]|uniref:hypothetical protein n=1 Tax=Nocardiopsis sp. CNR-923 TaxID=1904965 RepID=UPI0009672A65|nr:hypothetical protein [Nocardiopsis sp. CNR-923]OLT28903.1 hypothetical protein BJF83_13170 [Nocardiopsis sp. CNR-923]